MSTGTVSSSSAVVLPPTFATWATTYFDQVGDNGTLAPPKPPGSYPRILEQMLPRLERAKKKNTALAGLITSRLKASDALSAGGKDDEAVAHIRDTVERVESAIEDDRAAVEKRLIELFDKATAIALELNPDAHTVRATVRKQIRAWDFETANASLNAFEKAIEKAKPLDFADLNVVQERRAKEFRKENAKFARNTEQALLAARRVVDDQGNLITEEGPLKGLPFVRDDDLGSVAEEIGSTKDGGLPQSVHALQMLKRLQTDKAAQEALKRVAAPPDPDAGGAYNEEQKQSLRAARSLIRNTLGLAGDAPITDVEAKRAAVAALVSQVRQVEVGSCFATASAVRVQRNRPEQFLSDIQEMFATGKLTRQIEHPAGTVVTVESPISRDMVDRKVDVARKNTNLHLNPRMISALDSMGVAEADQKAAIEAAARKLRAERAIRKALPKVAQFLPDPKELDDLIQTALGKINADPNKTIEAAVKETLQPLMLSSVGSNTRSNARKKIATDVGKDFDDVTGADDFTPEDLLKQIAKDRPGGPLDAEKVKAAKAAFDTSHDNTLMRAWEYTLATVAEKHPAGIPMGPKIRDGVSSAVQSLVGDAVNDYVATNGLSGTAASNQRAVADTVANQIKKKFEAEFESRYDPGVGSRSGATAPDGASTGGGYCLFFRGKKIDGQAEFEAAVKTLAEESKTFFDTNTLGWPPEYVKRAKALIDDLKEKAETKDFRDKVMDAQAKSTVGVPVGDPNYNKKLNEARDKFAKPWTRAEGGFEHTLMQVYENQPRPVAKSNGKTYTYTKNGTATPVRDAEGLAHFIVGTLKTMGVASRLPDGDEAERAVVPVASPTHAFNLTPGSPALKTFLKQGKTPEEAVAQFKEFETAKNVKRRTAMLPLADLAKGLVADMVKSAVNIFPADKRPAAIAEINNRLRGLGADTISPTDLKAQIKAGLRAFLDANYGTIAGPAREEWSEKGSVNGVESGLLTGVIPKEEYGPLVDAALRKMGISGEPQEKVKKEVLEALKNKDAVVKDDLAKEARIALRKLGYGVGDQDTPKARQAYDALGDGPKRVAALKAAGIDAATPAATFDALTKDQQAALTEHGVADRLDERLAATMTEPRGLVFADPNWGSGDHMTKFSMVVNPLTDAIEMWQMNEDGTEPRKMDQASWVADGNWDVYTNPDETSGAMGDHDITTGAGAGKQWEAFRAGLKQRLDACYQKKKGDLAKLQRYLEFADQKFAASEFASAEKALDNLDKELTTTEKVTKAVDEAVKNLTTLKSSVKSVAVPEAKAAEAVVDNMIRHLETAVHSAEDLPKFLAGHKDVLDYIKAESPFGDPKVVEALTVV